MYGVSVDSYWAHEAWRQQLRLPDDLVLLSDFNRDFGRAYGLLHTTGSGMREVLRRGVLVVGRDGKVAYRHTPEPPQLPRPDDVLAVLRALP